MTDLMPLYKTMKKATFSDSEDEVRLLISLHELLPDALCMILKCNMCSSTYTITYHNIFSLCRTTRRTMKTLTLLERPRETTR